MSLRKILGRILVFSFLHIGALSGVSMDPEHIRRLMELMHRTKIVQVVKKDDPP